MKTKIGLLIASGVLTLGVGCGSGDNRSNADSTKPPITVTVAQVERQDGVTHSELLGSVAAKQRADIQTKVQARVERIPVVIGSRVRKGDLLVEFDTRETGARVQQARALYQQASQDLKRFETLLSQNAATQQEFDGVKARYSVAEAALSEAEGMLSYARIAAPFSGTVTRKDINEGDLAVPGRPLLSIEDESTLQLVVSVAEALRGFLRIGDTLEVGHTSGGAPIPAIVDELSPSADPVSRTITAKLTLAQDSRLHAGQTARLLLPSNRIAQLTVPETAVARRGQLELVYAVTAEDRAALKLVRTGRRLGGRVEILSGLTGDERVVLSPAAGLEDRDPVEVQP